MVHHRRVRSACSHQGDRICPEGLQSGLVSWGIAGESPVLACPPPSRRSRTPETVRVSETGWNRMKKPTTHVSVLSDSVLFLAFRDNGNTVLQRPPETYLCRSLLVFRADLLQHLGVEELALCYGTVTLNRAGAKHKANSRVFASH